MGSLSLLLLAGALFVANCEVKIHFADKDEVISYYDSTCQAIEDYKNEVDPKCREKLMAQRILDLQKEKETSPAQLDNLENSAEEGTRMMVLLVSFEYLLQSILLPRKLYKYRSISLLRNIYCVVCASIL